MVINVYQGILIMRFKRLSLLGCLLFCLCIATVTAQDATPEATPSEVTAEATQSEATAEPTSEVTMEVTVEMTSESTAEATAEVTKAATTEATIEATSEATAEATPIVRFDVPGNYAVRQPVVNLTRQYVVHVPAKYFEMKAPVPLLLVLHGAGGTGQGIQSYSGFDAISDKEGFLIAYPDAINTAWNDNRGDELSTVDDVGYLEHIIESVAQKANIDLNRVYTAGYSRGGMMAYRMGCVAPTKFAAVASVASTFPMYLLLECQNAPPKAVMIIQGTDDPVVPWMGIQTGYFSAADSIKFWGQHNRCTVLGPIKEAADLSPLDGTRLLTQEGSKCQQPIVLYSVFHGGHTWPGHPIQAPFDLGPTSMDFDAAAAIWDFFKGQSLKPVAN
jgi:polyhydroxybutyrate depolymerase